MQLNIGRRHSSLLPSTHTEQRLVHAKKKTYAHYHHSDRQASVCLNKWPLVTCEGLREKKKGGEEEKRGQRG